MTHDANLPARLIHRSHSLCLTSQSFPDNLTSQKAFSFHLFMATLRLVKPTYLPGQLYSSCISQYSACSHARHLLYQRAISLVFQLVWCAVMALPRSIRRAQGAHKLSLSWCNMRNTCPWLCRVLHLLCTCLNCMGCHSLGTLNQPYYLFWHTFNVYNQTVREYAMRVNAT